MELSNTYETLTKQMAKGKDVPSFIYEAQTLILIDSTLF